jgi:HSP20 family protein
MTRLDPFVELTPLWNEWRFPAMPELEPAPAMRIDLAENDATYTVKAEIPGVKKEDITVSIDGDVVSITAEVKREKEEKEGEKVLRSERYYGSVAREFTLPTVVDMEKANATYDGGVLTLTLPKAAGTKTTRLAVH